MMSNDAIAAILDPDNQKCWIVAIPKGDGVFSMHYNGPDFRSRTEAWRLEKWLEENDCLWQRRWNKDEMKNYTRVILIGRNGKELLAYDNDSHNLALIGAVGIVAKMKRDE